MMRKRKKEIEPPIIEPLPWIDVPQEHVEALDLDPDKEEFDAVYFASNGAAVVSNGKTSYIVPAMQASGVAAWLDRLRIRLDKEENWLVINLPSRQGYILGAEPAEATLQVQWADPSDFMLMEDFLRDYGGEE